LTATQPFVATAQVVKERQENQQDRIHQGMKSGELTKKETMKLEAEQAKIQKKKRRYKKSGGTVTSKEKADIMSDQDKASKHIYKEKHDAQTR
ncbi:MAG: hypothetical protein L0191_09510, partial [Acidobacteria bacterium]|nr:hypothetical protein [Acidobacteriota bacterium]